MRRARKRGRAAEERDEEGENARNGNWGNAEGTAGQPLGTWGRRGASLNAVQSARNGMRRTMAERWRKGGAKPGMADALKVEPDAPSSARFSASTPDKTRGIGGNYFPRRGVGRSPAYQNFSPRGQTGPALPGIGRCIGNPTPLPLPPLGIHSRQNKGVRGKLFPPAGCGAEPRIPNISQRRQNGPALPGSGRCIGNPTPLLLPAFRHLLQIKQGGSGEIISPGGAWGGAPHTKTSARVISD